MLLALAGAAPSGAQTLPELAARALAADPGVRDCTRALRAAEQRPVQARAAFGPNANFTTSTNKTQYREEPDNTLRPFTGDQYTLQVSQPLRRGTLVPAVQAAQSQFEQAQSVLAQAHIGAQQRLIEAVLKGFKVRDVLAEIAAGPAPALVALGLAADGLPVLQAGSVHAWLATAEASSPQMRQAQRALDTAEAEAETRKAALPHAHAPSVDLNASDGESGDTGTVQLAAQLIAHVPSEIGRARYGRPGKLELEYPPLRKDSLLAFDVESHRPYQGAYEALSFNKDGYRFPVYRVLTSEPGQAGKSGLQVCRLAADRIAPPVETTCKSPLMPLSMGLETVLRAPR